MASLIGRVCGAAAPKLGACPKKVVGDARIAHRIPIGCEDVDGARLVRQEAWPRGGL